MMTRIDGFDLLAETKGDLDLGAIRVVMRTSTDDERVSQTPTCWFGVNVAAAIEVKPWSAS